MINRFGNNKEALFVDAACYKHRACFIAAVINYNKECRTSLTIKTRHAAEETAIALAIAQTDA